jgi:hypothetical protein
MYLEGQPNACESGNGCRHSTYNGGQMRECSVFKWLMEASELPASCFEYEEITANGRT